MSPNPRPRQAIGGTQEDVRRHNLATMLGHLHVAGPLRRADLTGLMGLNRSTIAALVAELAALGAVREERPEGTQTGAGRPSLVVQPRASRVQVLAADVGVGRVSVALVGLGGIVVARPISVLAMEDSGQLTVEAFGEGHELSISAFFDPPGPGNPLPTTLPADPASFDVIGSVGVVLTESLPVEPRLDYGYVLADMHHVTLTPVPEPSTYGWLGATLLLGVVCFRRRQSRRVLRSA
jgi:hypothetical protein